MTQIILDFDMNAIYTSTTVGIFFDNILLKPGENKLSPQDLEILRRHPDYLRYRSLGAIAIIQ